MPEWPPARSKTCVAARRVTSGRVCWGVKISWIQKGRARTLRLRWLAMEIGLFFLCNFRHFSLLTNFTCTPSLLPPSKASASFFLIFYSEFCTGDDEFCGIYLRMLFFCFQKKSQINLRSSPGMMPKVVGEHSRVQQLTVSFLSFRL